MDQVVPYEINDPKNYLLCENKLSEVMIALSLSFARDV